MMNDDGNVQELTSRTKFKPYINGTCRLTYTEGGGGYVSKNLNARCGQVHPRKYVGIREWEQFLSANLHTHAQFRSFSS
jgi:hypothetical protein